MSNNHILICPFNESIINMYYHKRFIIRTSNLEEINNIRDAVCRENTLSCIILNQNEIELTSIDFKDYWKGIPIAIFVSKLGSFKKFIKNLELLRKLNIKVFLPSYHVGNYISARIMSSLGISCGIQLIRNRIRWDLLSDLMAYCFYTRCEHSPVEPFEYIISNYKPTGDLNFSYNYFDDIERFLYINEDKKIALSEDDFNKGNFISHRIESLDNIENNENYNEKNKKYYNTFINNENCAYCPSFRVCKGNFLSDCKEDEGCKSFFSDLMDAADFRYQNDRKRETIWQL